jgi:hypothetical protein
VRADEASGFRSFFGFGGGLVSLGGLASLLDLVRFVGETRQAHLAFLGGGEFGGVTLAVVDAERVAVVAACARRRPAKASTSGTACVLNT